MADSKVKFAGTLGKKIALVVAVLAIGTCVFYYSYEAPLKAVDTKVMICLALVAVCDVAYAAAPKLPVKFDVMGVVQIAGAAFAALSVTTYLNSDIANLADLLNGVTIFSGGQGNATTIFTLAGLMVAIGVAQIVTCFMKSE